MLGKGIKGNTGGKELECSNMSCAGMTLDLAADTCGKEPLNYKRALERKGHNGWDKLSLDEALNILSHSSEQPPVSDIICLLQKYRKDKNLKYAKSLHAFISTSGLNTHKTIGNYVIPMFVECGSLSDALKAFSVSYNQREHPWSSLMLGCMDCGQSRGAFKVYQVMEEHGVHPSAFTFMGLLRACSEVEDVNMGRQVHLAIKENGLQNDLSVNNALINMYIKCGSLLEAQGVFDDIPSRDVVSWSTLIAGYVENKLYMEASKCIKQMQLEGVSPDTVSFICSLKACGSFGALDKIREIHAKICYSGFEYDLPVGNTLISTYAKCGSLSGAWKAFSKLPVHNVVSWTTIIAGYAENGLGLEALKCFELMQLEGISPNVVTFLCILKVCAGLGAIGRGRKTHTQILQKGFEGDISISNSLIDMYAKCGSLLEAQQCFDKVPFPDVVTWTAMISAYADNRLGLEALQCYRQMQVEGLSPNDVTFLCILRACSSAGAIGKGREVHNAVSKAGWESNPIIGSALVDMYAKCGLLTEAQDVFAKMSVQNVVSWTAMILGYAENGFSLEALSCFKQMQEHHISPNVVTILCILKACGNLGAIERGRELHFEITEKGLEEAPYVGNCLIDMYAKCGALVDARKTFDKLPVKDAVSWTTLLTGYSINNEGGLALQCFEEMQKRGIKPDAVSFIGLLAACSRSSLVLKGLECFKLMTEKYGILPLIDHYICMIDLFARAGHFNVAEKLLQSVPCQLSKEAYISLLGACKNYGEAELGLRCFQQLVEIDPENAASYMLMANTYADSGMWEDAIGMQGEGKSLPMGAFDHAMLGV